MLPILFWSRLESAAKTVCFVMLSLVLFRTGQLTMALTHETLTREAVVKQIPTVLDNAVNREMSLLRKDLVTSTAAPLQQLDNTLVALQHTLSTVDSGVVEVTSTATTTLDRYRKVPDDVAWVTDKVWNCEGGNQDCLENRYTTLSRSADKSLKALEKAIPQIAASSTAVAKEVEKGVPQIVANSAAIAENINKMTKPKWYDKLLKVLATAALVFK